MKDNLALPRNHIPTMNIRLAEREIHLLDINTAAIFIAKPRGANLHTEYCVVTGSTKINNGKTLWE